MDYDKLFKELANTAINDLKYHVNRQDQIIGRLIEEARKLERRNAAQDLTMYGNQNPATTEEAEKNLLASAREFILKVPKAKDIPKTLL